MITGEAFREDERRWDRLAPELVRQLSEQRDSRAWMALLDLYAAIAVMIWAAVTWWHPLVVVPLMFLIATRQQACFVIAHDAAHYRLFRNRRLNDIVGRITGGIVGISMPTYRVTHRLHHNHLYGKQDPDIPLNAGYPRGRTYLARKLFLDLFGRTAFMTYRYFFGAPAINAETGDPNRPLNDTSPRLRAAARADRWWVLGFHMIMPCIAWAGGFLLEYLILWVVPLLTFLQPLLRLRAICEHGAVSDYGSPLTAARTNTGPKWLLWLFFPYNVNFHIEHHLYPSIPFYNLPVAHDFLTSKGLLDEAEVRDVGETMKLIFAEKTTRPPETAAT
ncbi:MAG: fatty acid desaturase family protein [Minwuia sp.]|uniref:fatty acid desaturase family protein n=1 Tax=Minwuia sp. TaxID=2493630 RepID=UPI003A8A26CB